jgi:hypothetical protein
MAAALVEQKEALAPKQRLNFGETNIMRGSPQLVELGDASLPKMARVVSSPRTTVALRVFPSGK